MSSSTADGVRPGVAAPDPVDGAADGARDDGRGRRLVSSRWRTAAVVLLVLSLLGAVAGVWAVRTAAYRPAESSAGVRRAGGVSHRGSRSAGGGQP